MQRQGLRVSLLDCIAPCRLSDPIIRSRLEARPRRRHQRTRRRLPVHRVDRICFFKSIETNGDQHYENPSHLAHRYRRLAESLAYNILMPVSTNIVSVDNVQQLENIRAKAKR